MKSIGELCSKGLSMPHRSEGVNQSHSLNSQPPSLSKLLVILVRGYSVDLHMVFLLAEGIPQQKSLLKISASFSRKITT